MYILHEITCAYSTWNVHIYIVSTDIAHILLLSPSLPPSLPLPPSSLSFYRPDVLTTHVYPHTRHYAASTVSLDFRTPMGSTRSKFQDNITTCPKLLRFGLGRPNYVPFPFQILLFLLTCCMGNVHVTLPMMISPQY